MSIASISIRAHGLRALARAERSLDGRRSSFFKTKIYRALLGMLYARTWVHGLGFGKGEKGDPSY